MIIEIILTGFSSINLFQISYLYIHIKIKKELDMLIFWYLNDVPEVVLEVL